MVDVKSQFSCFQLLAFSLIGLASSIFVVAPILLRFFLFSSSMHGLKYVVTGFLISTCKKKVYVVKANIAFGGFSSISQLLERS